LLVNITKNSLSFVFLNINSIKTSSADNYQLTDNSLLTYKASSIALGLFFIYLSD